MIVTNESMRSRGQRQQRPTNGIQATDSSHIDNLEGDDEVVDDIQDDLDDEEYDAFH